MTKTPKYRFNAAVPATPETAPSVLDMELALADYYHYRDNVVVPNVSWGLGFPHECDLFVLTKGGYGHEIEIKRTRQDLLRDLKKRHGHWSPKIRYLWYAVPNNLEADALEHMPAYAGILVVEERMSRHYREQPMVVVRKARPAKVRCSYKFDQKGRDKLLHLAAMRLWNLKRTVDKLLWAGMNDVTKGGEDGRMAAAG